MEKTKNTIQENKLTTGAIPPNLQRYWEELQRKYYPEKYLIIDFEPTTARENYWRWHINLSTYKSPFQTGFVENFLKIAKLSKEFKGNEDLKVIFDKESHYSSIAWTNLEQHIQTKGFFVPKGEIARLDKDKIESYILYLKLKTEYLPFIEFLKSLKKEKEQLGAAEIPLPIIAIWQYFPLYAKFLKQISTIKPKEFKSIRNILVKTFSPAGFQKKLPSEQMLDLLLSEFQVKYFNGMTEIEQQDLVKKAHPVIQTFWERYVHTIRFITENGMPPITKRTVNHKTVHSGKDIADQFYKLFEKELEWVKIQEIIDPYFENEYSGLPLDNTRWKFRPDREKDATESIKKAIGDKSILERIKESGAAKVALIEPYFMHPTKAWVNKEAQKWSDFTYDEQAELLETVKTDLTIFQQEEVDKAAKKRWNVYFQSIGNQLLSPFFYWETSEEDLVPQWNILEPKKAIQLDKVYDEMQLNQIHEKANLERCLQYLYSKKTLAQTQKIIADAPVFSFPHLRDQWERAAKAQLVAIRHKGDYRLRKMREFGMLKGGRKPDANLEKWLDELLKIEKEIGPYIPFVKKAFLMALPTQTSTEFDPYRHSHDGIEFDPETTQDQHKWMRGEVMKSLRTRIGKSDAEQVNAFALDFSGSMRHKRMRNLFKILYLMVLGLEDRKSYDAFHFFGTDFIETVNFSNDYTNRSLLFRILQQIARLDYEEGVRYGGVGGTNMSEGIIGCHERIKIFSQKLKEIYPKRFFLKSIFVITDGEPSLGIHIPEVLNREIEKRRKEGSIAIKGIYLKPKGEEYASFMERIFGKNNFVETDDFAEAINRLVYIMTQTYKQQRIDLRQQKIKEKYERSRNLYQ